MNRMLSGATRAAGSLAAGAAAGAGHGPGGGVRSAGEWCYALQAAGPVSVQRAKDATYDGGSPVIAPNIKTAGLLSTGVVTDRAGAASASSRLPGVVLALPGQATLRARAVSSSCRSGGKSPAVSGTAGVTGGVVQAGHRVIRLPVTAAPNTRVVIPGSAVIMVNRQYTGAGGTLTVAGLRIRMLRGHRKLLPGHLSLRGHQPGGRPGRPRRVIRLALGGLGLLLFGGLARAQPAPPASRRLTPGPQAPGMSRPRLVAN